jgi:hypothetical protein
MKIWAHTLVCNEEKYVWFAVSSVINYVDKILLWDTGSTDHTTLIIKKLKETYRDKIDLKLLDRVTPSEFTKVRQEMLNQTESDWVMILDGDEVWWQNSIDSITKVIGEEGKHLDSIVTPNFNVVGDIFHYQEKQAGGYHIDNHHGHINIRFFNKLPGLHFSKPHGVQGIYDENEVLIQDRNSPKRRYINLPYMHFTNAPRSFSNDKNIPKRSMKLKYDLGINFEPDFFYPEVFFIKRPEIVPTPWIKRDKQFEIRATLETPFRRLKRRILPQKVGY